VDLRIFRSAWGFHGSIHELAEVVARSTIFGGIEVLAPTGRAPTEELLDARNPWGVDLAVILLIDGDSPSGQISSFSAQLEGALALSPDVVIAHSGRDFWSTAEAVGFYEAAVSIESDLGVRVAHETHRGRTFATPWETLAVTDVVPDVGLCVDLSHWVVVCERLLEDQQEGLARAAANALHVHARVGTTQCPQVSDPADPSVANELSAFEGWWDRIWESQRVSGIEVSTMCPEYGPPPYQPLGPKGHDRSDQLSEICDWQARRSRRRFERLASGADRT
jgi:sugar phosphate isomerase/epimerase